MTHSEVWLTGATLAGTAVVVLAILTLLWSRPEPNTAALLFGVPPGEILMSLASLGLIVALAFSGYLDMKIAGTLLGAHLGYHAAASGRNRSRSTPPEHPRDLEHQRDAPPSTTTTQSSPSPPAQ